MTSAGRRAPTGEPDWLTLGQAARFLGVAQSTIRKWSDQGRVPAFYDRSGPGGRTAGPLVLVVDDDARLREFIRVNLELEGYVVREASSAEEALEAIEGQAPDLVLLDVVMPGIDGWQMLQRMQERHGSIPVIMFSGQVGDTAAGDAEERGARGFIGKPFDPQQLIERAKQLVPA
jgi:CheY-like chemotaxis protein